MGDAPKPTLLLVEDDASLARGVRRGLNESGYRVDLASDSATFETALCGAPPALVLLDLGLPGLDGLTLIPRIREAWPSLPILITTARDRIQDRVKGLEAGADDYLVKPFALEELLARIRALLRRSSRTAQVRSIGSLSLDLAGRRVIKGDRTIDLTPREFDLLYYLQSLDGGVASKDQLQREVWRVKSRMTSMDNIIEVHVSRLRQKLEAAGESGILHTVRGVGYVLKKA